jgi:hypothetical protein
VQRQDSWTDIANFVLLLNDLSQLSVKLVQIGKDMEGKARDEVESYQ